MIKNKRELIQRKKSGEQFSYRYFWGASSPFSQFYESSFSTSLNGEKVTFTCAEQFMMFMKALTFNDTESMQKIIEHPYDPKFYKAIGRKVKNYDDKKWGAIRYNCVVAGNKLKFSQNNDLKNYMLATKHDVFVEASPYDKIWGVGLKVDNLLIRNPENWKGENLLGFALMEVRESLK